MIKDTVRITTVNTVLIITFILLATVSIYLTNSTSEKTEKHTILSIDKVEEISSSNGDINTNVYYVVATDKGVYHIETKGFNAHPECLAMKEDSTYMLTTRGINVPFIGRYATIIGYQRLQ